MPNKLYVDVFICLFLLTVDTRLCCVAKTHAALLKPTVYFDFLNVHVQEGGWGWGAVIMEIDVFFFFTIRQVR